LVETVILNNNVKVTNYSCDDTTKPADDLNKIYTQNPTSENQAYVQDSSEC
jgi:hypothetical protein